MSRTIIDVNRDPSGASLYPGQATTDLCPTTTFDGEPLYRPGAEPDADEIADRRARFFDPYHAALAQEIVRLRASHPDIVLYDCHSIRCVVPRLFEGELPNVQHRHQFRRELRPRVGIRRWKASVRAPRFSHVRNGRFKGGWITRHYGRPAEGVHVVQMELACRGYMQEPVGPVTEATWPPPSTKQPRPCARC